MARPKISDITPAKRATFVIALLAVMFVLIPFLFWRGTWFGRELTNDEISEYLSEQQEKPRHTQHALAQISERMNRSDPAVKQWYPQIILLAHHRLPELRLTVAWLMGQDAESEEFHSQLREMVGDPNPMVRRNAALSLARFHDAAGRPELLAMLTVYTVTTDQAGVVTNRLKEGDTVDRDTLLARLTVEGEPEAREIRSPVPGIVRKQIQKDGAEVKPGDPITLLGPDPGHAYEALRGLYLVGSREDLEAIRPFLRPNDETPAQVIEQARLTSEHLRERETP